MIFRGSRYEKTRVYRAERPDGESVELLEMRVIPDRDGVYHHRVRPGERLDHLGERYYRDPLAFYKICDASDRLDPFDVLEAGEEVLVPPNK